MNGKLLKRKMLDDCTIGLTGNILAVQFYLRWLKMARSLKRLNNNNFLLSNSKLGVDNL
jgi:hypothetical protein